MTITQDQVRDLFEYRDGELYWKINKGRVKIGDKASAIDSHGYLRTSINGKLHKNHRIIFLMFNGYLPDCIDHIDGNPSNNRVENLRKATLSQNQHNAKTPKTNTSGIKGVNWYKRDKKWCVQLRVNGKKKHFGYYDSIEAAKLAIQKARVALHGAFANHGEIK
jgi:hypothetical protein